MASFDDVLRWIHSLGGKRLFADYGAAAVQREQLKNIIAFG
jgi:hypothetical protein